MGRPGGKQENSEVAIGRVGSLYWLQMRRAQWINLCNMLAYFQEDVFLWLLCMLTAYMYAYVGNP